MVTIKIFKTESDKVPYLAWLSKLDKTTRNIVRIRIERVRLGNFGDFKPIKDGNGLYELRIAFGPGYRVYFMKLNIDCIAIINAGTKKNQKRDIITAKKYWEEHKENYD